MSGALRLLMDESSIALTPNRDVHVVANWVPAQASPSETFHRSRRIDLDSAETGNSYVAVHPDAALPGIQVVRFPAGGPRAWGFDPREWTLGSMPVTSLTVAFEGLDFSRDADVHVCRIGAWTDQGVPHIALATWDGFWMGPWPGSEGGLRVRRVDFPVGGQFCGFVSRDLDGDGTDEIVVGGGVFWAGYSFLKGDIAGGFHVVLDTITDETPGYCTQEMPAIEEPGW